MLLYVLLLPTFGFSQRTAPVNENDLVARIKDEGTNRSQVMQILSYLTDVIDPRLTGSPNMKRANEWTRDKLTEETRTHHSNQDVFDRIQADDMKQAAIIMATFVYNTAMMDEKLPRKPMAR